METRQIIKELRQEKGLTQKELGEAIHYSLSVINKWENGKKGLSVDAVKVLARFYDVSTDEILNMDEFRKMKR